MFEMKRSDYIVSRQKWFQVIVEELEKFDTKGIFLHEITDNIAPLYSTIIKNPLCIDKIKNKLIYYQNLTDFRQDFNLIIENCQHYNDQETIFYQDSLMFQKEIENIFHQDGLDGLMTKYPSLDNYREIFPEFNQSIDNIKNFNEQAAERAASKIKKAKLDSVFLRRNNDGSTSLNLINPETSNQTPIVFQSDNFGEVLKKLKKTSQLISFRENGLYLLKPVKTLDYDPFSEYAPKYDSTFAKCKLNEFNDVLSHSASLNTCVGSKNDYSSSLLSSWVDHVSDKKTTKSSNSISTSEAESKESDCQSIDEKLKATSELIEKLSKLQHVRLTTEPKDKNYQNVTYPSKEETTLSQQLRSELQLLIATLHPAEVINADSLHNLMGINSEALNKTKSLEEN